MHKRSDTMETTLLAIELLRRIPRKHKITASQLHQQLKGAGFDRDLRTVQRQLEALSEHFDIERDERSKPYGYRWLEHAQGLAVSRLTAQESLLLELAHQHLKNLLPPRLLSSMEGFFAQARRNLDEGEQPHKAHLERQWPKKVRVVATSQPLLPPSIRPGVLDAVSDALYANRWLELDYRNAARQQRQARVMPLGLAQQGPRLYLVCRFDGYDNERSLALHRIRSAQVSTLGFDRPPQFDLQKYDDDERFGFGEGHQIRLRFWIDKEVGFHLHETPLSKDQQIRDVDEDWMEVTATVVDSAMLDWWLRGFAENITNIEKRK